MRRVLAATCLAVAGAVALGAQTPTDEAQRKGKAPATAESKTVNVTGCLRAGDQPNAFVLTNVKMDASAATKSTGTTGTTAMAPNATLRLIGAPANLNMKAHVGHTVTLTGMFVPQSKEKDPTAGTAGTTPPTLPPSTPPQPDTPPSPPTAPPAPPKSSTPPTTYPTPPAPATPPDPAATVDTRSPRQGQRGAPEMQTFNVKSMQHVSEKCPM
jgi:hypothetical protein